MKRPQTKFHAFTMSHSQFIRLKRVKIYRSCKLMLQHAFFLFNNKYRYAFASLGAIL